eukprot:TRINITY_DN5954_c0_g1_i2.p2 TRINITY_DN5954_c0_g1~~TRINITY_DN5954_c0_g1_i2.p2  ORF type:complete len:234 (+),score=70.19 TRINITY_DN5954_c0_g1_i2:105-704(+)
MGNKKSKLSSGDADKLVTSLGVGSEQAGEMRAAIKCFHAQWTKATNGTDKMNEEQFIRWFIGRQEAEGSDVSPEVVVRDLFKILDQDASGELEFSEAATLLALQSQLGTRSNQEYAELMVEIYDVDGDRKISRDEYLSHLRVVLQSQGLQLTAELEQKFQQRASLLFSTADADGDGELTADEIAHAFDQYPELRDRCPI